MDFHEPGGLSSESEDGAEEGHLMGTSDEELPHKEPSGVPSQSAEEQRATKLASADVSSESEGDLPVVASAKGTKKTKERSTSESEAESGEGKSDVAKQADVKVLRSQSKSKSESKSESESESEEKQPVVVPPKKNKRPIREKLCEDTQDWDLSVPEKG